jgi:hypothetical protein
MANWPCFKHSTWAVKEEHMAEEAIHFMASAKEKKEEEETRCSQSTLREHFNDLKSSTMPTSYSFPLSQWCEDED